MGSRAEITLCAPNIVSAIAVPSFMASNGQNQRSSKFRATVIPEILDVAVQQRMGDSLGTGWCYRFPR
jgi:hypothetical protein